MASSSASGLRSPPVPPWAIGQVACLVDAVRRVGMAGEEIVDRAALERGAGDLGLQLGAGLQRLEEVGHGRRVVAGAAEIAHAELVGLELLAARVGLGEAVAGLLAELAQELRALLAAEIGAGQRAEHAQPAGEQPARRLPGGAVPGGDVADLVANDTGELGLVLRQRQEPPADIDIAAGQREGVDDLAVQDGEGEIELAQLGDGLEPVADALHVALECRIVDAAAVLGQNLRVRLAAGAHIVLDRARSQNRPAAGRRRGAARGDSQRTGEGAGEKRGLEARHGRISIPWCVQSSIIGPFSANKVPRKRTRRPSSADGSKPACCMARSVSLSIRAVVSVRQSVPKFK